MRASRDAFAQSFAGGHAFFNGRRRLILAGFGDADNGVGRRAGSCCQWGFHERGDFVPENAQGQERRYWSGRGWILKFREKCAIRKSRR